MTDERTAETLYQVMTDAQSKLDALRSSGASDGAIDVAEQEFWAAAHAYEAAAEPSPADRVLEELHSSDPMVSVLSPRHAPRPGRPRLSAQERTVMLSVRVTEAQRNTFIAVGGSQWLREQLDYVDSVGNRLFHA